MMLVIWMLYIAARFFKIRVSLISTKLMPISLHLIFSQYEFMKDAIGARKEFVLVSPLEKVANVTASLSSPRDNDAPSGAANNLNPKRTYKKRAKY